MLNLEKHIAELLFQYDCVIVPNLGGFVANLVSADFNEKTGVFNPPGREIGFNRSLYHNDGLLINFIANKEGLTYEACQNKLTEHIEILKSQLSEGEIVYLKEIGSLKTDSFGHIIFEPLEINSFSTSSFGLSTFHFNTLLQDKEQNEVSRRFLNRTVSSNKSIRSVAASVALVLGLLFISPSLHHETQQGNFSDIFNGITQSVSDIEDNTVAGNISEENKNSTAELETENVTKEDEKEDFQENINSSEEVVENIPDNKYFIIAGSFKILPPANKFLKKVLKQGYSDAEILEGSKGRYRVSLEGFVDKQEAVAALESYRNDKGYKNTWLLKKN